ncbi:forkhead box protein B2 [Galendromus occidentalis]|uniref:Forkhead box protein B2 n=1 Tax=Galendromus occidentalis TaxID=34638 RepID=A0AAJ6VY55_9ACAR|nr:forkhead box protein B2 [Galendromus occidentalis]
MASRRLFLSIIGLISLSRVHCLDTEPEGDGFHETEVQGRHIPKQHHHSVHYRPTPAPPYIPVDPFQYTPTPSPPRYPYEPAETPRVKVEEVQPIARPVERKRQYYAQECGCVPFKYVP